MTASFSFLQAFEAILEGKCPQYAASLGSLSQVVTAMIKLYKLTKGPGATASSMVSPTIVLILVDRIIEDVTIMLGDNEPCTMTASQVAEVYTASFFLRGESEISNSLDFD